MSKNMYGLPNHIYLVLGGFKYSSDPNGLIANVLDGIEEPSPEDPDREQAIARQAYDLLHTWRRLPGTNDDGTLDPAATSAGFAPALNRRSQEKSTALGRLGCQQD